MVGHGCARRRGWVRALPAKPLNALAEREREKRKMEPLEPRLHALEMVRITATSLLPSRVDRW
jgi:hypothetical protein